MWNPFRKKSSVMFEVYDPDGDLVMVDSEPITKASFNELVKLDPDSYPPGKYECVCNGETIWTRTIREKVVKSDDNSDDEVNDPLGAIKESVERINQERETLAEFKASLDSILGTGNIIDMSNAPENLRDGISKGMGAAVYSGLLKNDTEAVNKVFSLMDGITAALNGVGLYLASESKKTGKSKLNSLVSDITSKVKPDVSNEDKPQSVPKKVNVVPIDAHKKTVVIGNSKQEEEKEDDNNELDG